MTDKWRSIKTAPKDGKCLLLVDTDEGYEIAVLPRDKNGNWIYEGEPTFCLAFYYDPIKWMPFPKIPKKKVKEE